MKTPTDTFNQEAIDNPKAGDYWTERVFCPYFLVLKVEGDVITILDNKSRIIGKDSWTFDYSAHQNVSREWMKKKVSYSSGGFVADVTRDNETMLSIVDGWKQFHRNRIYKELAEFL